MERMIANRLKWYLDKIKLLSDAQCGFRTDRSTKDCLMKLHDDLYKSIANKRFSVAIFLDIEKAYDLVWRKGLLYKLSELGIKGNILAWLTSFLSSRSFKFRVCSTLYVKTFLENGVPQGSVLSPLLFSIMINDLPKDIRSNINIFADDICIWESSLNLQEVIANLQSSLDKISTWCKSWGFRITSEKSAAMVFTRRRNFPPVRLKVNDITIPMKEEYKYIGIILDTKLSFNAHSKMVEKKCHTRINFMRLLSRTS